MLYQPHQIPHLPPNYLPRPQILSQILAAVTAGRTGDAAASGETGATTPAGPLDTGPGPSLRSGRLVLQGKPGCGKSTLAAALAREPSLAAAFPDGIFWLRLGRMPDLTLAQAALAQAVGADYAAYSDPRQGRRALRSLFHDKACLLVLDDVYDPAHASSFDCLGPAGMLFVTGRESGLAGGLRASRLELEPPSLVEGLELLRRWLGDGVTLPSEAARLVELCGRLPLALAMVGGALRAEPDAAGRMTAQLGALQASSPEELLMQVTLWAGRNLPYPADVRYQELAVFPEGALLPLPTLQNYWTGAGLNREQALEMVRLLVERALLFQTDATSPAARLHEAQTLALRSIVAYLTPLHQRLLLGYGKLPPADDGYIHAYLVYHLNAAERMEDVRKLLFDFAFLRGRLLSGGMDALLEEYNRAAALPKLSRWERQTGAGAHWLRQALRLAAFAVAAEPANPVGQLAAQLTGRLQGNSEPDIQSLLTGTAAYSASAWLRPLTASLSTPGSEHRLTLAHHRGAVQAVLALRNGRHLVSAGQDGAICVWHADSGRLLNYLSGHDGPVTALAFMADQVHVASGGQDGRVVVWNLEQARAVQTLESASGPVTALAAAPDGRKLLVAGGDGKVQVWELGAPTRARLYQRFHAAQVQALAALPGSLQAVSAGREIKIWDLQTGDVMQHLAGHTAQVTALLTLAQGERLLSAAADGSIKLWNLPTGIEILGWHAHNGGVTGLTALPGETRLASTGTDGKLKIWDLTSAHLIHSIDAHTRAGRCVSASPDGRWLASGGDDGQVRTWELSDAAGLAALSAHNGHVSDVFLLPDGMHAVSGGMDGTVRIWNLASGRLLHTRYHPGGAVYALALAPDGKRLAAAAEDGRIFIWGLQGASFHEYEPLPLDGHGGPTLTLQFAPDGKRLLSGAADANVVVWDVSVHKDAPLGLGRFLMRLEGHSSWVRSLAVLPDGWRAAAASADHTVRVWDLERGELIHQIEAHYGEVNAVLSLKKGRWLLTAGDEHLLRIWDADSGRPLFVLQGHQGEVDAVAVTGDGQQVVSVSHDRRLCLWQIPTGLRIHSGSEQELTGKPLAPVATLQAQEEWLRCVAVTPDGERAVTGSEDGALRTWDLNALRRPWPAWASPKHAAAVNALAFSADGRRLLSAANDGSLKSWELRRNANGALAEAVAGKDYAAGGRGLCALQWFGDGQRALLAGENSLQVFKLGSAGESRRQFAGLAGRPLHLALSEDGHQAAVVTVQALQVWDVLSGQLSKQIEVAGAETLAFGLSRRGRLALLALKTGRLEIWDTVAGERLSSLTLLVGGAPLALQAAAFAPDGRRLVACSAAGHLAGWELDAALRDFRLLRLEAACQRADADPLTESLALPQSGWRTAAGAGFVVSLYDLAVSHAPACFQVETELSGCAIRADGQALAAGDRQGAVHILIPQGLPG